MRRQTASTLNHAKPRAPRPSSRTKERTSSAAIIRRRLLNWYDKNKRDLPWRHKQRDPYAQWVAEIMLQQTRVETVLRYYQPFLARFPTFENLAKARHEDVLKMWEGLGYYRRILHLHRAVKSLCEAGVGIPTTSLGLKELPGVGLYTASAIASISFDEPVAAVDANVARVIGRLLGMNDTSSASSRSRIQNETDQLLCNKRPGDFNQAWMDLGSSICLPRKPQCGICPLKRFCTVGTKGDGRLPVPKTKAAPAKCSIVVGMVSNKDRLLLTRRPEGGLWSGLWEFPSLESRGKIDSNVWEQFAAAHTLAVPYGVQKIGVVRHQLSHRSISFRVFAAEVAEASPRAGKSIRWVSKNAFERLPVSTAHRRIHRLWMDFRARLNANSAHH